LLEQVVALYNAATASAWSAEPLAQLQTGLASLQQVLEQAEHAKALQEAGLREQCVEELLARIRKESEEQAENAASCQETQLRELLGAGPGERGASCGYVVVAVGVWFSSRLCIITDPRSSHVMRQVRAVK
jgi:hypothetical protein